MASEMGQLALESTGVRAEVPSLYQEGNQRFTVNAGSQQTPLVASVPTTACAIAQADMGEVTEVDVHFIAVLLAVLLLVTYVPVTGMGLVELFYC